MKDDARAWWLLLVWSVALFVLPGSPATARSDSPPRIVSLSPALSATLVALGLGDRVVGRTPWCRGLPARVPVVGDAQRIDYERLLRVRPTHVLRQSARPDPELQRLATEHGWRIERWARLERIAEIRSLLEHLPHILYGDPIPAAVARRRDALLRALDEALALHPCPEDPGPIALVTGADPPLAFGRGTYLDDLLRAWGLRNAVSARGWVALDLETLARSQARLVVWVNDRASSPPPALQTLPARHLVTFVHPAALLPAASLPQVARALAETLGRVPACTGS